MSCLQHTVCRPDVHFQRSYWSQLCPSIVNQDNQTMLNQIDQYNHWLWRQSPVCWRREACLLFIYSRQRKDLHAEVQCEYLFKKPRFLNLRAYDDIKRAHMLFQAHMANVIHSCSCQDSNTQEDPQHKSAHKAIRESKSWKYISEVRWSPEKLWKCAVGGARGEVRVTKTVTIHPQGDVNVCTKFHGSPSKFVEIFH